MNVNPMIAIPAITGAKAVEGLEASVADHSSCQPDGRPAVEDDADLRLQINLI